MKSRQLQPTAYEETVDNIAPHDQRLKEVLRQRLCTRKLVLHINHKA